MSEVTFAKAFLSTLDRRPIKLSADHASDPRSYPNQSPFIVPKQTHPFPQRTPAQLAQKAQAISVTIKPMRGGDAITLSDISLDDSIHDLKTRYAQRISTPLEKIKLLHNKKPAADLKTFKDLGIAGDVELAAMIMGGATVDATPIASSTASTPTTAIDTISADKMDVDKETAQPGSEQALLSSATAGPGGPGALHTADFWNDLQGFLTQRLRDDAEAEKLTSLFKAAWSAQ